MSQKYLLALATAAAMLLTVGFLLHPDRVRGKRVQAAKEPNAETPQLQRLSRRGQMSDITDFLGERVREATPHVLYVPSTRTSGIVWSPEAVVTTTFDGRLLINAGPPGASAAAPVLPATAPPQGWAVLVARQANGRVVSSAAVIGGTMDTSCEGRRLSSLVLNVPIRREMAGAGVFDISGEFVGLVVNCGRQLFAVPHAEIAQLIAEFSGPDAAIWNVYAMQAAPPTKAEQEWLRTSRPGLLVRQVRIGGRAANIGLRPGDLILDASITKDPKEPLQFNETLSVWRNGRTVELASNPPYSFETPERGLTLSSVTAESRLGKGGLQAGDQLVALNGLEYPTEAQVARLIGGNQAIYLVYEREGVLTGALLP
jgi:hypothetical protein